MKSHDFVVVVIKTTVLDLISPGNLSNTLVKVLVTLLFMDHTCKTCLSQFSRVFLLDCMIPEIKQINIHITENYNDLTLILTRA